MKVTPVNEASRPPDGSNRSFHLSAGNAHKFWRVCVDGTVQTVRFGRIGTDGQTCVKTFPTPSEARQATERLIGQKLKKGYQEVSLAEAGRTPLRRPERTRRGEPRPPEFRREQLALPF